MKAREFSNAGVPVQRLSGRARALLDDADRCVKCGLCLPHCPTYALHQNEAESPRGRITLLQSVAEGRIPPDASVQTAIDHCLSCRACEAVCPAQVRYGQLFDTGQALLAEHAPGRLVPARRRQAWLARPTLRRTLLWTAWIVQRLGFVAVLTRVLPRGGLRRALSRLPLLPRPRALPASAGAADAPRVQIFSGCMGDSDDRSAVEAAMRLLGTAGYRVELPPQQRCCGALAAHAGDAEGAERLLASNTAVFGDTPDVPVVALASGCTAMLQDAHVRDAASAHPWLQRLDSVWRLLAEAPQPPAFRPTKARVSVWLACTQRHVVRDDEAMCAVLERAAGAGIELLQSPYRCCGAAGTHFLDEAERADALARPIVEALRSNGSDTLLCANVGCRLHLAALLRESAMPIRVLHPAEWLAERLPVS